MAQRVNEGVGGVPVPSLLPPQGSLQGHRQTSLSTKTPELISLGPTYSQEQSELPCRACLRAPKVPRSPPKIMNKIKPGIAGRSHPCSKAELG